MVTSYLDCYFFVYRMLGRTMTIDQDSSVTGGMSITGCLNDFSLYVFHPYGGGRKVIISDKITSTIYTEVIA